MPLVLIAHNLRSAHNVGSLLRTAEGLGAKVILSGYTPYPVSSQDDRLPHIATKLHKQISKTALGAESSPIWSWASDVTRTIKDLKSTGYKIYALEQSSYSVSLPMTDLAEFSALILGREVEGIEPEILALADETVEIPMFGQKESYNVVQAAAMAMYQWRFKSGIKHK